MRHSSAHSIDGYVPRSSFYDSPFGRLFGKLTPWEPSHPDGRTPSQLSDAEKEAVIRDFAENQMFEAAGAGPALDNPDLPAGYTYFGQFIDHDITFDPASSLQRRNDPEKLRNFRTPRFDLDSVYGAGPGDQPFLYDGSRQDPEGFTGFFLIGTGENVKEADLPRNDKGTALIGDKRNDENVIVSQIQLAFLKLHNRILESLSGGAAASQEQFLEAQRIVRWFYQFVVWNDFVKRIVPADVWSSVLKRNGGIWELDALFYGWRNTPFIPVEFSVAAYRFGHSMVRPGYQINLTPEHGFQVEFPIFLPNGDGLADLRGGQKLRKNRSLQWDWYLKFLSSAGPFPQLSRLIDPLLARSVFHIPAGPGVTNPLAFLNIKRGWRMELPSATSVAKVMGLTPMPINHPIEESLWVYILKEAQSEQAGKRLGTLGGRIVAEVFGGLLIGDPQSYASCDPNWTPAAEPHLPFNTPENDGEWQFRDIIRAAGVPITAADIAAITV